MIVRLNERSTCDVFQTEKDVSAKRGKYIDLKKQPERANELPETKEWPAFGAFLEALNRCEAIRTAGCSLDGESPSGEIAPFVEIVLDHEWTQHSPTALRHLYCRLHELNVPGVAGNFILEVCRSTAHMPDGGDLDSFRLWLLGSRPELETAFPLIVAKFKGQLIRDYVPVAEPDYKRAMQEKSERKQEPRGSWFVPSLMVGLWLGIGGMAALLCSNFGWTASVVALASWILSPVVGVGGVFLVAWLADRRRNRRKTLGPP
jgi:hypothetical protein